MTDYYKAGDSATVQQMLDGGAEGLMYFESYLPRYKAVHELFGFGRADLPEYSSICAMYDAERGMDLDALAQIADTVSKVNGAMGDELRKQQVQLTALPSVWQGAAADAAHTMLAEQVRRADVDRGSVIAAGSTLSAAVPGLRSVVKGKAETVASYWNKSGPDIGNLGRKAIDNLIVKAETSPYDQLGIEAKKWLQEVFVPHVDHTVDNYTALCKKTESDVRRIYGQLADGLTQLNVSAYPTPADAPAPSNQPKDTSQPGPPGPPGPPGNPTTTSPASTVPSSTTPASTVPASTTPTTTVPSTTKMPSLDGLASLSQVANQLSPLASGLSTAVTQGISSLSSTIKSGVDEAVKNVQASLQATSVDKDHDGKPDKPAAEFDVAGKHLKFEMGPNGELKLAMSGADGKTQEFSLKLDEHGLPVLSMNESKPDGEPAPSTTAPGTDKPAPSTEAPKSEKPAPSAETPQSKEPAPTAPKQEAPAQQAPAPEQSTGQPGMPSSVPPVRRGEDGEHKPKPMPGSENPEAPFDSGARLAEAGPL